MTGSAWHMVNISQHWSTTHTRQLPVAGLIHILELFQVIVLLADWTLDHNLLSGYPFLSSALLRHKTILWSLSLSVCAKNHVAMWTGFNKAEFDEATNSFFDIRFFALP